MSVGAKLGLTLQVLVVGSWLLERHLSSTSTEIDDVRFDCWPNNPTSLFKSYTNHDTIHNHSRDSIEGSHAKQDKVPREC